MLKSYKILCLNQTPFKEVYSYTCKAKFSRGYFSPNVDHPYEKSVHFKTSHLIKIKLKLMKTNDKNIECNITTYIL